MWGQGKSPLNNLKLRTFAPVAIECVGLIFILAVAWGVRLDLPTVPISDPDTWGYLHPCLAFFSDRGFLQTNGRDWLYPFLVAVFIKTTGSIAGLLVWQKALGLAAALLMALAWRLWVSLLPLSPWQKVPIALLGLLPIYIQQINPQNLLFEVQIRPESVLAFVIYAQLTCVFGFCRYRWKSPKKWPALIFGGLAILFAAAALSLKPSWLFAAAATVLPVVVGMYSGGTRLPGWVRFGAPILGVLLVVSLLWLPDRLLYTRDATSRTFMPGTLFTIHADLIEKDLERKVAELPDSDPEKERITPILAELRKEMITARSVSHGYETLGFDPDYLFYRSKFNFFLWDISGHSAENYRRLCLGSYRDAFLHNPVGFARKIIGQYKHFLFPSYSTFYRPSIDLQKHYRTTLASYDKSLITDYPGEVRGLLRTYLEDVAREADVPKKLARASFARDLAKRLTTWALPLEVVFLGVFLWCLFWPAGAGWRLAGFGCFVAFAAPAGNAFTVSVAHALDLARYRYSYGGIFLFALTTMVAYIALVGGAVIYSWIKQKRLLGKQ